MFIVLQYKYIMKKENQILIIGTGNTKQHYLIQAKLNSKQLMVSKLKDGVNTTTQAWSTKMISLMDGEELSIQIILSSLMHNGKMEFNMDTLERFFMMVGVMKMNFKMVKKLEVYKVRNLLKFIEQFEQII